MNIIFYEVADWQAEYLKKQLPGHQLYFLKKDDPPPVEAEILSNFIGFAVDQKALAGLPNLKYITTRSTGYDHIDISACAERGIAVSNVPAYGENTVAEFTFALLLALARKLYPAVKQVREEGRFSNEGLEGFDLKNKILGVIGTGHIGEHVVRIAKGFEMQVVAFDPHPKPALAAQYGFAYGNLDDVLARADIVTLHVPYLPETHHLINKQRLEKFKKGAILINTARGGLVETEALLAALKNGSLACAGLDVLEEEGYVKEELSLLSQEHPSERELKVLLADHELMQMDNVLMTPHNAFNSREALERILDTTVANIKAFIDGQPINLVKPAG